jgi:hypothetical protein
MRAGILIIALALAAPAAAEERLEDFGYAVPIEFAPGDALYVLRLPEAVYRHAMRADLGDLRVFNGAGEVIPHALRQPVPLLTKAGPGIKLPQFPVRGSADRKVGDDLRVEVRRDGAVVSVRTGKDSPEKAVTAWLVDASAFEHPIETLELALIGDSDVVARIGVDSSDDLKVWHRVVADAPVVRTRFGGERLEQLSVPLHGIRTKYLRLVDARGPFSFELAGVRAVKAPETASPDLESWRSAQEPRAPAIGPGPTTPAAASRWCAWRSRCLKTTPSCRSRSNRVPMPSGPGTAWAAVWPTGSHRTV